MEKDKIIKIGLVILVICLLGYGVINNNKKNPKTDNITDTKTTNGKTSIFDNKIFWIVMVIVGMAGMYGYMKKDDIFAVKSMTSDEQEKIVLVNNLIRKEGLPGYYDENNELQLAHGVVKFGDKRLHCDRISGAEFMLYDAQIINPYYATQDGICTFNVQLNRNQKEIQGGSYSMFRNTNQMQWIQDKSYLKKLPQAHPQSDAMRIMSYGIEEGVDQSALERLNQPITNGQSQLQENQPDYLYSNDDLHGGEGNDDIASGQMDSRPRRTFAPRKKPFFSKWRGRR